MQKKKKIKKISAFLGPTVFSFTGPGQNSLGVEVGVEGEGFNTASSRPTDFLLLDWKAVADQGSNFAIPSSSPRHNTAFNYSPGWGYSSVG